jgi:hypothetical protein
MCGYGRRLCLCAPLPALHTLVEPRHRFAFGRDPGRAVLTRLRSANDARTISVVGDPLSPSGVAYILQPSAYPALSGTGNRSSLSTLIVGLPGRQRI